MEKYILQGYFNPNVIESKICIVRLISVHSVDDNSIVELIQGAERVGRRGGGGLVLNFIKRG